MIRTAILTISDSCSLGKREDVSGQTIEDILIENEFQIHQKKIVADDYVKIASELEHFSDKADIDVVLTTGGTGLGPRDVTPESVRCRHRLSTHQAPDDFSN